MSVGKMIPMRQILIFRYILMAGSTHFKPTPGQCTGTSFMALGRDLNQGKGRSPKASSMSCQSSWMPCPPRLSQQFSADSASMPTNEKQTSNFSKLCFSTANWKLVKIHYMVLGQNTPRRTRNTAWQKKIRKMSLCWSPISTSNNFRSDLGSRSPRETLCSPLK